MVSCPINNISIMSRASDKVHYLNKKVFIFFLFLDESIRNASFGHF